MMRQKPPVVPVPRNDKRKELSLARTIERYQGKMALLNTWQGSDKPYVRKLRKSINSLRVQLRAKGLNLINRGEIDDMTNLDGK